MLVNSKKFWRSPSCNWRRKHRTSTRLRPWSRLSAQNKSTNTTALSYSQAATREASHHSSDALIRGIFCSHFYFYFITNIQLLVLFYVLGLHLIINSILYYIPGMLGILVIYMCSVYRRVEICRLIFLSNLMSTIIIDTLF